MPDTFNARLKHYCQLKNNRLCIGLDLDPDRLKARDADTIEVLEKFGRAVVEATIEFTPVYKLNMAFYERHGSPGYALMERLIRFIGTRAITIADGKRGDIGNTGRQYAKAVFHTLGADALTVSPYMGKDSILPFIADAARGAFVLGLTSNSGAEDIQLRKCDGTPVFMKVAVLARSLNRLQNVGLVVGATKPQQMQTLSEVTKGLSWLIPGIGAQGGDLEMSLKTGNAYGTGIVNISRGILYAGDGSIEAVREAALEYTMQIRKFL